MVDYTHIMWSILKCLIGWKVTLAKLRVLCGNHIIIIITIIVSFTANIDNET